MRVRETLILHPRDVCPAVERIEVEVSRSESRLRLRYLVTGDIAQLSLPPANEPVRANDLWHHTCFEAFIGTESNYLELNLAPSRAWAAYRFEGEPVAGGRPPRRDAVIQPPDIRTYEAAGRFELRAEVQIMRREGRLGLSAMIEERNGRLSHWALSHPADAPNFHHPDCFVAELPRW